jgi:hypothetical protein
VRALKDLAVVRGLKELGNAPSQPRTFEIGTPIIFDFNGRVIIPWSVRRIGALGDNTVELLSDVCPTHFSTSLKSSVLADR